MFSFNESLELKRLALALSEKARLRGTFFLTFPFSFWLYVFKETSGFPSIIEKWWPSIQADSHSPYHYPKWQQERGAKTMSCPREREGEERANTWEHEQYHLPEQQDAIPKRFWASLKEFLHPFWASKSRKEDRYKSPQSYTVLEGDAI